MLDDFFARRIDQEQRRLLVIDGHDRAAVGRQSNPGERARGLDLPEQFSVWQIDDRDCAVLLVLSVKAPAIRCDDQAMAVCRSRIDHVHHRMGSAIDHRHDGAVLAGDVDQSVGTKSQRVRGDVGPQVDVPHVLAVDQIEDAEEMPRIRIAAVNTVAEDRHVGETGFRDHQQLVHVARKPVEHNLGRVGRWIEKQDLAAHLVDRDQPARTVCFSHVRCS